MLKPLSVLSQAIACWISTSEFKIQMKYEVSLSLFQQRASIQTQVGLPRKIKYGNASLGTQSEQLICLPEFCTVQRFTGLLWPFSTSFRWFFFFFVFHKSGLCNLISNLHSNASSAALSQPCLSFFHVSHFSTFSFPPSSPLPPCCPPQMPPCPCSFPRPLHAHGCLSSLPPPSAYACPKSLPLTSLIFWK